MVEHSSAQISISLGLIKQPKNRLIMKAPYFPSKAGGKPAWLNSKQLPPRNCAACKSPLVFLLQLYSALEEDQPYSFHRTIFVFACLSEQCIGKSTCTKVYRGMLPLANEFFPPEEPDYSIEKKSDQQLEVIGKLSAIDDSDDEDDGVPGLKGQKEIEIYDEDMKTTAFYVKESRRIKDKKQGPGEDEDYDEREAIYLEGEDAKTKELIKKLEKEAQEGEEDEEGWEDDKEAEGGEEFKQLEKMIEAQTQHLTDEYRLYEYVIKK